MIGKYEIIAQPIAGSAHMLRYTVFVSGKAKAAKAAVVRPAKAKKPAKDPKGG